MKIIAEIGWNHLGDISLAKKMIVSAKESGATVVKFQLWDPEYMKNGDWNEDGRIIIYRKAKLSDQNVKDLTDFSKKTNIEILFSAFGSNGASRLLKLNFNSIKIPSHEIANKKLIDFCSKNFEKIFISTGASKINEVEWATKTLKLSKKCKYFNLMHCVSSYPCEINQINLPRLNYLKNLHDHIGLSDHTSNEYIPSLSVIYGASVIEKHFTIDNNLDGRDNKFALEPKAFKKMAEQIKFANLANQNLGLEYQNSEKDIIENYRGRWEPKDYE